MKLQCETTHTHSGISLICNIGTVTFEQRGRSILFVQEIKPLKGADTLKQNYFPKYYYQSLSPNTPWPATGIKSDKGIIVGFSLWGKDGSELKLKEITIK